MERRSDDRGLVPERRLDLHGWRLDALDNWRKDVERRVSVLEDSVEGLTKAEEIAVAVRSAVSQTLEKDRRLKLTPWQRLGALVGGLLFVWDSLGRPGL